MTALSEFQRLEATGLWHPAPDAQRRDVILSIGEATLTITDHRDMALAHWSLAAIERVNPGKRPAVYAPGPDAPERVETEDETMIRAIEKVRRAVARARPHPGRLRQRLVIGFCAAVAVAAVFWLPGALIRYTAGIVPEAARTALGQELLDKAVLVSGAPCANPEGRAALDSLTAGLGAQALGRVVILPAGVQGSAHFPGDVLVLNRAVVEDHETPRVVAGYILAESARAAARDPMLRLLEFAGIAGALRLLTTGHLSDATLSDYAQHVLTSDGAEIDTPDLLARFAATGVPSTPYAYAIDISGEATLSLIEADPSAGGGARVLLSDDQWVALQGICGG